jgi:ribosome-associated protein
MLVVTPTLSIDPGELVVRFVRASGPGGQNVNKVASAVELRFDARRSPSLPDDVAARLIRLAGSRATQDGVIVLQCDTHRTQEANRREATARLLALVAEAAVRPKKRLATRPTLASRKERLEGKARRSGVKSMRRTPARGEE